MKISEAIRAHRISKKWTQNELAEKTRLSLRTIQRIESGEVKPSLHSLKKIQEALNMHIHTQPHSTHSVSENMLDRDTKDEVKDKKSPIIPLLFHLSGIFALFIPSLFIWALFKEDDEHINVHGAQVLNFQLVIFLSLLICAFIPLIFLASIILGGGGISLILLGFVGFAVIPISIYNAYKVVRNSFNLIHGKEIHYPQLFRFFK